jgi:DNA-binding response OmpR family regulator
MGMTENIKQKLSHQDLDRLKQPCNVLIRNTKKLLFLINQMLDLSKIESGNMVLNLIQTDIIPFIKVNLDSFHSLANNKNINLTYYYEDDKIIMDFDPEKISAIISNLLSNAIKFTPENGSIILHVKKDARVTGPYFILKIKDNGIGISEKDQKHIFDRFYQVDEAPAGGTGIGLSLTKELVQLMNGKISVSSSINKGAEFKIELPITNKAEKPDEVSFTPLQTFQESEDVYPEEKTEEHSEDLSHVLIIEDNKDVAHFIASGLKDQYEIIFAQDGREGIEKALDKIPDLIITDLMMPEKDGFEVCDVLKNDERTSHIPVIMLTARTFVKDKIKGLAHGADAYLTKPFNQSELLIRIEQLILLRKRMQQKYQNTGLLNFDNLPGEASFIKKCITAIQQNLSDENFRSSQLSFTMNLSESQLYRKLKAVTNLSTAVFIRDIRLQAARELLQKSEKNISEIAYSCGFSNPDWFSKSFKEKYGYSPTDYRERY